MVKSALGPHASMPPLVRTMRKLETPLVGIGLEPLGSGPRLVSLQDLSLRFPEIMLYCAHPASFGRGVARDRHDTRGGERWPWFCRSVSLGCADERRGCGREVAACRHPDAGVPRSALKCIVANGGQHAGAPGRLRISVKTVAQGMPVDRLCLWCLPPVLFFRRRAMGGAFTRHSLRPPTCREGEPFGFNLGHPCRGNETTCQLIPCSLVIVGCRPGQAAAARRRPGTHTPKARLVCAS